jgi:hypothetical protein
MRAGHPTVTPHEGTAKDSVMRTRPSGWGGQPHWINSVKRFLGDQALKPGWPASGWSARRGGADGQAGAGGRRRGVWPVGRLSPHLPWADGEAER